MQSEINGHCIVKNVKVSKDYWQINTFKLKYMNLERLVIIFADFNRISNEQKKHESLKF